LSFWRFDRHIYNFKLQNEKNDLIQVWIFTAYI
jgi:hypothetical protein